MAELRGTTERSALGAGERSPLASMQRDGATVWREQETVSSAPEGAQASGKLGDRTCLAESCIRAKLHARCPGVGIEGLGS